MADSAKQQPVRVCFISPKAYPLFNTEVKELFGGAEVDLYLTATEFAKDKNFEVSFITADYGQKSIGTIQGVKVIKSLDFSQNALTGALRIWRAMKQADADIYILKTASPGTPLVALFCLLHHRVFAYRTASVRECDGTYTKDHFFLGKAFIWSLRKAKVIFTQNAHDKDKLAQTVGLSAVVIPNGHRLVELNLTNRDTVLWVGRSAEIKRPELFIDLAEKTPSQKFTMICQRATGDDNYQQLLDRANAVKNLEFIERVPFNEIDSCFARAKVFVNTSDSEGFPNTFIQACTSAVPILSLNVNPDGFLDKYECGICCDGNWDVFLESLTLMLDEDRRRNMGANAGKYAAEHHDITKIVEQYKEIFIKLADSI